MYYAFISPRRDVLVQVVSVLTIAIGHYIDGTVLAYPSSAIPSLKETKEIELNSATEDLIRKSVERLARATVEVKSQSVCRVFLLYRNNHRMPHF